ncbi:MAG TPA: sn-glycerol-3-phosphate ABC transporter ATP-binding protein UgpC [Acidimicrobiales bacterium]|nr:sn-glycerol-3-phosphate ABC transporter ATP-binding protein UgpC [Acidimicrobiales bacterium]
MAAITFDGVTKIFAGKPAVDSLSLHIDDGEFMVLVGPSGCGKTTALRMLAGLEEITSGQLLIGDQVVNNVLPKDRDVAMVFQNYALYPHMSVAQNMGFALKIRGESKATIAAKVRDAAEILRLSDYLDRRPRALSGGQRQRVAMGRAIVRSPQAFLMDEPLSNLDAKLRVEMRLEIARIQRLLGVATLYVTHDQVEAMTMGDRVAVMRDGQLQQVARPQDLYDRPANDFVAGFIGSPPMNLLRAHVARAGDVTLSIAGQSVTLPAALASLYELPAGGEVTFGIRPEDIVVGQSGLRARVERCEALGAETLVHLSVNGEGASQHLVAKAGPRTTIAPGDELGIAFALEHAHFFDLTSGATLRVGS